MLDKKLSYLESRGRLWHHHMSKWEENINREMVEEAGIGTMECEKVSFETG